ncbi:NADPH-dependent FMN reductase [Methyloversatilis universalis FAM5]|uniref:Flavoprotein WrbA n=1 Tax=Methyloversatilis universalis (strain ATCC BAA-1314 / DSM 25237 / JCM 13912 / CCUG 52030 / FAM5) TaxID=1000565 RepID=F5R9V1_METUF|nr:flavodoxin family protein [Methyloversatilis universalis]EGK72681.1 NADPH-dependent FMN reductase [Methyloversatilis universalis FAM5]
MKRIAIVHHSAHGHTEHIARHIRTGCNGVSGVVADLLRAEELVAVPEQLGDYEGIVLGSPTYLGGVSGPFKSFMDSTGGMWPRQSLKGKLAAAFTVSSLHAGDKQSTLLSLFIFSMQHGMLWMGNPILPEQHVGVPYDEAANRLGSWSGLMAQAGHASPPDAFVPGDVKTARLFGSNFAHTLLRLSAEEEAYPAVAEVAP